MSKLLDGLNRSQQEAVRHTDGPLLIIAGPGSGKTRTVVRSIAYAIIENGVQPDRILAFSFTVKACEELREQVRLLEKEEGQLVNVSTFHSFCRKVLKEDLGRLHRTGALNFQDLDEDEQEKADQRRVAQAINHLQYKSVNSGDVLNFIIKCKTLGIRPSEAENHTSNPKYAEIYEKYEQRLKEDGWIDYPNQLLFTDELLTDVPEVKKKWQEKFDLIFVDEYQDTDRVQYRIIKALAEKHQNLRVVGDDDQGIYGWRGADIQNILNFENDYLTDKKPITLGQNYRSTQRIVEASRALADFNPDRREKELFTRNRKGEKVKHLHCENDKQEAEAITSLIYCSIKQDNWQPRDFAVLYRTRKQAKAFEEAFSNMDAKGVSLMTIHGSKGLEFPNVFVAGVCSGLLPHYNSKEEDWDEELRLLYVAMTRAKNWLCLSSYEEDVQYPRGKSPFLDYIPTNLLESIETFEDLHIPPRPPNMTVPVDNEETTEYVDPLPISPQTIIGIDPGNIGARTTNVGWSITQKSSQGYSVLDFGTERPTGTPEDKIGQIAQKIKTLIQFPSNRPHAIAVEKLEVATTEARKEWFLYVAACVTTVRSIADKEGIECRLYTPQDVKYAATNKRKASKEDVQKGVMRICNLQQIPEPHHSADAIATSLCYLRNYLNSARFEGNKRKQERYKAGCDYLDKRQYEAAVDEFKEAINIDPIYADVHCGLGGAYFGRGALVEAENSVNETLRLETNHQSALELQNTIKQAYYERGIAYLNDQQYDSAITAFNETIRIYPNFIDAYCKLGRAYLGRDNLRFAENSTKTVPSIEDNYDIWEAIVGYPKQNDLVSAEKSANEALRLDSNFQPARALLENIKQAHYNWGSAYIEDSEYVKAIDPLLKASNIDPNDKDVWSNLGRAYYWIDDYVNAASCYRKVTDIDPNDKTAYTNLGNAYYWIGKYEMAINLFQKAINIDRTCEKTRNYLVRARSKLDKKVKHERTTPRNTTLISESKFQIKYNDKTAWNNKKSVHSAYIDSFYADQYAVTNKEYKKFLDANPQWSKKLISREYHDGSYLKRWYLNNYPNGEDYHSVVHVSWYAAIAYAQWVGKRLPTEAEWEKAASVGGYRTYGSYSKSGYVSEWCLDEYRLDFYENPACRNPIIGADNTSKIINNFANVKTSRVLRSGNWNRGEFVPVTKRYSRSPASTSHIISFRCVSSVTD